MENKRILIIDDDRDIWQPYQEILAPDEPTDSASEKIAKLLNGSAELEPLDNRPRFDLTFAAQGQEGLALVEDSAAREEPFAVAFVDIRMPPGWDGMETAVKIREIDPDIEIVIVTAYSDRSREEILRAVGAPEKLLFLRKPFDSEELAQIALSLAAKWNLARQEAAQRLELQTVLKTTPAAIFSVTSKGVVTSWNPAAEQITGFTAEEVVGEPCLFTRFDNACHCCLRNGDCPGCGPGRELEITDKGGQPRIIFKSISVVRDQQNQVVKAVESFWDITAKKEAEAALQESEARFRTLVETTTDWVWEVDGEGHFTYCSPLCEKIYGYRPQELEGQYIYDILLPTDGQSGFRRFFLNCLRDGRGFQAIVRRCRRKDGSIIYIETSGIPITKEDGSLVGFRGIDRDITERKKYEDERARLEEQYRQSQKMESLGTLAGGIAHDLNNMLTPIIGNAQLAMLQAAEDEQTLKHLQDIKKCAEKAAGLIRQILAFSRKQVLMPKVLNLNSLIEEFVKMLRRLIREDIDLRLELNPDLAPIDVDVSQVEQVLMNLVVNARDALPTGGEIVVRTGNRTLEAGAFYDIDSRPIVGPFVEMSVEDNGIGMDEATVTRIFDPFFTTKEVGKGTGMGLATVYGIVNQHNGHLRLETEPDRGTIFHVYFRVSEKPLDHSEKLEAVPVRGGDEVILLAEDDMEVRMITASTLEHYGYQVLEASSGTEAVRIFNELNGQIDLLLTDIVMPGLGGKAVAKILRSKKPGLPVIYMSGHLFDVAVRDLEENDHLAFLQKPFNPAEMAQKVREMLDGGTG